MCVPFNRLNGKSYHSKTAGDEILPEGGYAPGFGRYSFGLDGVYPYAGVFTADNTEHGMSDAPGSGQLQLYKKIMRSDLFSDFLMFKPNGGEWVPYYHWAWGWEFTASRDIQGVMKIDSKSEFWGEKAVRTTLHPRWEWELPEKNGIIYEAD